jgi:flagellar hook assembly protein FlgD
LKLTFTPNPFSPDADGFEDFTVIQYDLPYRVARIRIRIFDVLGRLVRTLANNEPSGARGEIVWDGRDDEGQRVRIGRYIVLLEAVDESGNLVDASKAVVVVAGKMR